MKSIIFTIIGLLITSLAFTDTYNGPTTLSLKFFDTLTINGPAKLKFIKAGTLDVQGALQFSRLDVAKAAYVEGFMKGDHGKFGKLEVAGNVDFTQVVCKELIVLGQLKASYLIVNEKAEILGNVEVDHGDFHDLIITAKKIVLEDATADSIMINTTKSEQTLVLKGNTTISGDITFESEKGVVQVDSPEVQIKGAIKGGTKKQNYSNPKPEMQFNEDSQDSSEPVQNL